MKHSIKDKLKYRDIEWMMPSVDVLGVLRKLGVRVSCASGDEVTALCPDHRLFVGRESSDPNWHVNTVTGKTFCFTEGRGSNLLWTVCRMLNCNAESAAKVLMGGASDLSEMSISLARRKKFREVTAPSVYREAGSEPDSGIVGLDAIRRDMDAGYLSRDALEFFMSPEGKKPTNILAGTVRRYSVFERTWGYYANRVIVPFKLRGELIGFCAMDYLGKRRWMELHPSRSERDYRKVLYPDGFKVSEYVFGHDECTPACEMLFVVEGAREVMKLTQEGFPNAVAILGGYMGDGQFRLITELAPKRIALAFDGDKAGRMITDRVAERLSRLYSNERILRLMIPIGSDPKNLTRDEIRCIIRAADLRKDSKC
jgi:hypothetical protein